LTSHRYEACGGGPITAALIAARNLKTSHFKVLHYANSGDVPFGDKSGVVGYLAAGCYRSNKKPGQSAGKDGAENRQELNREEQLWILELAEQTVSAAVRGVKIPQPIAIPEIAKSKRGAFVTLEKNHQLRGCIGYILPVYPLYQTIIDVAQSAALRDPRFPGVTPRELDQIDVEVSVLTVPETIRDVNLIEVGKHGIIIRRGYYQGLLLPQVATEYGWDRKTFLEHTCAKAGLPATAWQDPQTEIQIFSAQVFNRATIAANPR